MGIALFMLYVFLCQLVFSSSLPHLCPNDQALALLQFKHMFTINASYLDGYPKTATWNRSIDCCSWDGVKCDRTTGQVIELDVSRSQLQGKFHSNSSLFQLFNLERLYLSGNDFLGSLISPKFCEFSSLTDLDLSSSGFTGLIPAEISHLSKLYSLSIWSSDTYMLSFGPRNFEYLLKNAAQLRELELGDVNISSIIPLNFSSYLTTLRLHNTHLQGTLPERVFHLSNLESLDLINNPQLTVRFPTTKWNSSASLVNLYLDGVNATGRIPQSFSHLTSLLDLQMSSSNLSGPIIPLWNLTDIEELDLSNNHLEGPISQLLRFEYIQELSLGHNNFDGQLECLSFNISGLQNLFSLNLPSNYFNGTIPSWMFSLPLLSGLDLSNNTFSGKIPEFRSKRLTKIVLKQNQLEGPIPKSLLNQRTLHFLLLSHNILSGHIASAICNLKSLIVLDLGSNNLDGTIPRCLGEMRDVWILDLSNNILSGTIDTTFSIGNSLNIIKLDRNGLHGKVPRSLINCKDLVLLNIASNQLNDIFPIWLGALPYLQILSLRTNELHGPIKCSRTGNLFPQLRILDLSGNDFSGNLPTSLFANLQAMKIIDENTRTTQYVGDDFYYDDVMTITTKGLDFDFIRIVPTNMIVDLSKNRFEGYIPSIIGDLIGLHTLNLSHNVLEGYIPASLQHLSVLESLDLSSNKIRGGIPQQLASLTFLEVLNLSHNHLVGCIPKGKQFDTFENSSYQGNDGLRGFPLSKHCGGDDGVPQTATQFGLDQEEGEDSSMISWQAVLMGYGCGLVIGLSLIYIMLSTHNPAWFSRMFAELEHRIITRMKRHKKKY